MHLRKLHTVHTGAGRESDFLSFTGSAERMRPWFVRQAKNMKYAALTPKNTMKRTMLAAEIVAGIVLAPTR